MISSYFFKKSKTPCKIKAAAFSSNFLIFLLVFMSKLLAKLKAPSLENLSSHIVIGFEIFFDKFIAKSLADCEDRLSDPSKFIGFPMTIP